MEDHEQERTLIDAAVEHMPKAAINEISAHIRAVSDPSNVVTRFEDMERFADKPRRLRASVALETPTAFADYVRDFTVTGQTRVFASLEGRKIVAKLDYHMPDSEAPAPSWVTHEATYAAAFDESFAAWRKIHGEMISQRRFAEFLEDRAADAVTPDPADLMEIAERFEAIRNVDFASAVNLSTGERQFNFKEKDTSSGGGAKGAVKAPKMIKLRTPVFYGCDPVEWVARFAYDIDGGKLSFKVTIHRMQELLDEQFGRLCESVAVDLPGIPIHRARA